MSSKTRIVVLHMKEVIYTAIFLVLGLLMIVLLLIMFGPSKDKPSYDVSGQAMGGYMYMNGVSPTSGPLKVNPYLSDYITAYNACIAAMAGYIGRFGSPNT